MYIICIFQTIVLIFVAVFIKAFHKELSLTFQPPEEGQSVQRPKRCDKHGDKDEDNSPKNVNNVLKTFIKKLRLYGYKNFL